MQVAMLDHVLLPHMIAYTGGGKGGGRRKKKEKKKNETRAKTARLSDEV